MENELNIDNFVNILKKQNFNKSNFYYDKAFKDYMQKIIISQRKEKIKNIMEKINNNNI